MLRQIVSVLFIGASLVLASHSTGEQADTIPVRGAYLNALSAWERTLTRFVDDQGRTDFKALANDAGDLREFVAFAAKTSPTSHPDQFATPEDVIAYHLNAYNAQAMLGVIERGIPNDFDSFLKKLSFFKFRKIIIGGQKTSLYDYENRVIRPLGDARVHFALNCMVHGCPRLPKEPFRAAVLERQLETAAREFFSKEQHLRIDISERTLYLSTILDLYTEDFVPSGRPEDLASYVNQYLETAVPEDYKVRFIKYDWTINQQPD